MFSTGQLVFAILFFISFLVIVTISYRKDLKKLNNKLSRIETEIADLEKEIEKIDLELAQNYDEVSSQPNFFEKYKGKKAALDTLMADWEKIEGQISNFS